MSPRRTFLHKEFSEYYRTWRLFTMAIPVLLYAIASPFLVYFSPEILPTILETYENAAIVVSEPTWIDSYRQWSDSLKQVVPLLLIVVAITTVSGEISSSTVIPVLVGGLSRRDFVLIKFGVNVFYAITVIAVGTCVAWGVTHLLFGEAPYLWAMAIVGVASLIVTALIALAVFVSLLIPDVLSSVGLELLIVLLLSAATFWQPARDYSPVGLLHSLSYLADGYDASIVIPAFSTIAISIVMIILSVRLFENRDL